MGTMHCLSDPVNCLKLMPGYGRRQPRRKSRLQPLSEDFLDRERSVRLQWLRRAGNLSARQSSSYHTSNQKDVSHPFGYNCDTWKGVYLIFEWSNVFKSFLRLLSERGMPRYIPTWEGLHATREELQQCDRFLQPTLNGCNETFVRINAQPGSSAKDVQNCFR
jgi:hypothetical protein